MTLTEEFQEYIQLINNWYDYKEESDAKATTWQEIKNKEAQIVERLEARSYKPHHITHDQRVYAIDYAKQQLTFIYAPKVEILDLE